MRALLDVNLRIALGPTIHSVQHFPCPGGKAWTFRLRSGFTRGYLTRLEKLRNA